MNRKIRTWVEISLNDLEHNYREISSRLPDGCQMLGVCTKIASVVRIARKTLRIVKQNIVFALAIKALVLILGALGMANMWEAVFADVGVSVIAILNSMRTLNEK